MHKGYSTYEIAQDHYWIKTASGEPFHLHEDHKNYGLSKSAIDLLQKDIAFNYPDDDSKLEQPDKSICYQIYRILEDYPLIRSFQDDFFEDMVMWDSCYCLSSDPLWREEQKEHIQCVIDFIDNHGAKWVDLMVNGVADREEKKNWEVDKTPDDIVQRLFSFYRQLSEVQNIFVFALFDSSVRVSITLPLLFVLGKIDIDQFVDAYYYLHPDSKDDDPKKREQWKITYRQRILYGQEFIQIIGQH
jgi:hypothetical protein